MPRLPPTLHGAGPHGAGARPAPCIVRAAAVIARCRAARGPADRLVRVGRHVRGTTIGAAVVQGRGARAELAGRNLRLCQRGQEGWASPDGQAQGQGREACTDRVPYPRLENNRPSQHHALHGASWNFPVRRRVKARFHHALQHRRNEVLPVRPGHPDRLPPFRCGPGQAADELGFSSCPPGLTGNLCCSAVTPGPVGRIGHDEMLMRAFMFLLATGAFRCRVP